MLHPVRVFRSIEFLFQRWADSYRHGPRLKRLRSIVKSNEPTLTSGAAPVVFFNASTRTWGMSQNAAFSLLASWGLRLSGVPVRYFVCHAGMEQCVLGTIRTRLHTPPPCRLCVRLSRQMYPEQLMNLLETPEQGWGSLPKFVDAASLDDLRQVEANGLPIGELCIPSLRWVLRRHNLPDTIEIRDLFRQYLRAGFHIADSFEKFINDVHPQAVVVFNGVSFPEAIVRQVALRHDIPVITHEVGIQPFSAFFTHGEATAYPVDIKDDFSLTDEDEAVLDTHLSDRFRGDFSMAGIRFWQDMRGLDAELLSKLERYEQVVAVFTNVIFDTSQVHANLVFSDMFDWLRQIIDFARLHPDTLFVLRAHPDELRPGKESLETVAEALQTYGANQSNIHFIPPTEFVDSYELIQKAKLVMVYNSSIGLEATLLGKVVLCGGKSRYTDYPTVFFPQSAEEYFRSAERYLAAEDPTAPMDFVREARRFTFFQNFHTSLDFSAYLAVHPVFPGYVLLKDFNPLDLHVDRCEEIRILRDGILEGQPMVYRTPHVGERFEISKSRPEAIEYQ